MKKDNKSMDYFSLVEHYVMNSSEEAPYKCKLCGIYDIPHEYEICRECGWQDDAVQNNAPDYEGGANRLSLNQYRAVFLANADAVRTAGIPKSRLIEELFVASGGKAKYVNAETVQKYKAWLERTKKQ